jgi:hypothetical protein
MINYFFAVLNSCDDVAISIIVAVFLSWSMYHLASYLGPAPRRKKINKVKKS